MRGHLAFFSVARYARRIAPDTDEIMANGIYLTSILVGIPEINPLNGLFQWYKRGVGCLFDLDTLEDDSGVWINRYRLLTVNDPAWATIGNPSKNVPAALATGQNFVPCFIPVGIRITLINTGSVANDWYESSSIQKLGFVRRRGAGVSEEVVWINTLNFDHSWDSSKITDEVEIMLAAGVSGSCVVTPWAGIPPITVEGDLVSPQVVTGGWNWYGPDATP